MLLRKAVQPSSSCIGPREELRLATIGGNRVGNVQLKASAGRKYGPVPSAVPKGQTCVSS